MRTPIPLRRLISVTGVSAVAVALTLGLASPAQATTSATCVFVGAEGLTSPVWQEIGPQTGIYSFQSTPNQFGLSVNCVGAQATPSANGPFALLSATISSEGSYSSIACGTVSFHSSGTDTTTINGGSEVGNAPEVTDMDYDTSFIAGEGPISINSATLSNGDTVSGAGWGHLVPNDGCVPPAEGFELSGFFTVG